MKLRGVELLEEKNLFEIYVKSLRRLPPSIFNVVSTFLFFLTLACDSAYFPENFGSRSLQIRSLAELGLGFGSTILGFLIAGFTIFSTLSKPELFKRMHDTIHKKSGLSYLKVNFFVFIEVLSVYTFFLILCLSIKLFCNHGGLVQSLVEYSESNPINGYYISRAWVCNVGFIIFGTVSYYSLIALKSFIFNTYHSVITSVIWSFNPAKPSIESTRRVRSADSNGLRRKSKLRRNRV